MIEWLDGGVVVVTTIGALVRLERSGGLKPARLTPFFEHLRSVQEVMSWKVGWARGPERWLDADDDRSDLIFP